jgi:hypothetical protein
LGASILSEKTAFKLEVGETFFAPLSGFTLATVGALVSLTVAVSVSPLPSFTV